MSKKKEKPTGSTIVIRLNGDETTATILSDEFKTRITQTIAYRNPNDEYDAYIGARVALDRLFDKVFFEEHQETDEPKKANEPEKTRSPKFQVGDIVRVTNAVLAWGKYDTGDVAVVTRVDKKVSIDEYCYVIKVRSKERKGREGYAWEKELTLLHRAAKEGEKR